MNPQNGQYVKCFLRNSTMVEGVVKFWSSKQSAIELKNESSVIIIQNTVQDVMLVKILLDKKDESKFQDMPTNQKHIGINDQENNSFEDLKHDVFDHNHNKTLAELKIELNKQEREIMAKKLKSHYAGMATISKYEAPNFLKK